MVAETHALSGPSVEVSLHVDATAGALDLADRPVLLKGLGAIDRWLVHTGRLGDRVNTAVSGEGTLALGVAGRVVGAETLDNVVLDQRAAGPAVYGQVTVALRLERAAVVNGAG